MTTPILGAEDIELAQHFAARWERGAAIGLPGTGIDWIRTLAESHEALRKRALHAEWKLAKVASIMDIPDGGRYINDWRSKASQ